MAARNKRKHGCFGCLFRMIFYLLLIAAAVVAAVYYLPMVYSSAPTAGLSVNAQLPDEWMNVLLLGSDSSDSEQPGRTDTILIASIHRSSGAVKLSSIMRDTMVPISEHGEQKVNAAYRFGGASLAMKTVNEAFGMNISQYVVVDFTSFPYLIDAIGGIRLTIKQNELEPLNRLVLSMTHLFDGTDIDTRLLDAAGENVRVSGLQALAFSRLRSIDSDYQRTSRQRRVIDATLQSARGIRDPIKLYNLAETALHYVDTNIPAVELSLLGAKILLNGAEIDQYQIPASGTFYEEDGAVWCIRADLNQNKQLLREYIYGK